jgi:hypothetical protein
LIVDPGFQVNEFDTAYTISLSIGGNRDILIIVFSAKYEFVGGNKDILIIVFSAKYESVRRR